MSETQGGEAPLGSIQAPEDSRFLALAAKLGFPSEKEVARFRRLQGERAQAGKQWTLFVLICAHGGLTPEQERIFEELLAGKPEGIAEATSGALCPPAPSTPPGPAKADPFGANPVAAAKGRSPETAPQRGTLSSTPKDDPLKNSLLGGELDELADRFGTGPRVVIDTPNVSIPSAEEMDCPRCAERIKAKAKVCRFCGHELAPMPGPVPAPVPAKLGLVSPPASPSPSPAKPAAPPPSSSARVRSSRVAGRGMRPDPSTRSLANSALALMVMAVAIGVAVALRPWGTSGRAALDDEPATREAQTRPAHSGAAPTVPRSEGATTADPTPVPDPEPTRDPVPAPESPPPQPRERRIRRIDRDSGVESPGGRTPSREARTGAVTPDASGEAPGDAHVFVLKTDGTIVEGVVTYRCESWIELKTVGDSGLKIFRSDIQSITAEPPPPVANSSDGLTSERQSEQPGSKPKPKEAGSITPWTATKGTVAALHARVAAWLTRRCELKLECPDCGGRLVILCSSCGGTGRKTTVTSRSTGTRIETEDAPCTACGGTGRVPCRYCTNGVCTQFAQAIEERFGACGDPLKEFSEKSIAIAFVSSQEATVTYEVTLRDQSKPSRESSTWHAHPTGLWRQIGK
jgi:hypothetical protein